MGLKRTISINGREVVVWFWQRHRSAARDFNMALKSPKFTNWLKRLDPRFIITEINFFDIVVSLSGDGVRYIYFDAKAYNDNNNQVAGIDFMRGGSVAMPVILECEGLEYAVLTTQARLPTGCMEFPEIPAGTMDDSGNFAGKAAEEIQEELGITIGAEDLIDITPMGDFPGVFSSPGACDEYMRFLLYHKRVTHEELDEMQGRCTGLHEEGERIVLKVVPIEDLSLSLDAKTLVAVTLYEGWKKREQLRKILKHVRESAKKK